MASTCCSGYRVISPVRDWIQLRERRESEKYVGLGSAYENAGRGTGNDTTRTGSVSSDLSGAFQPRLVEGMVLTDQEDFLLRCASRDGSLSMKDLSN